MKYKFCWGYCVHKKADVYREHTTNAHYNCAHINDIDTIANQSEYTALNYLILVNRNCTDWNVMKIQNIYRILLLYDFI